MQKINIEGHSGCKLEITDNVIFKSTSDSTYSKRLKKQCEKQKEFFTLLSCNENLIVPEVLNETWDKNSNNMRGGGGR